MAGLYGLKILLLWAGIIGLAKCEKTNDTSSLPTHNTTISTLAPVASQPTPRTMTATAASDTPVKTHIPPLTAQTTTSNVTSLSVSSSIPRTMTTTAVMASNTSVTPHTPSSTAQTTTPTATSPPANNSHTDKTTNMTTDPQTSTSPPSTTSTTVISTTKGHYTVTPLQYGFQINITSSTIGNYTIKIKEEGQPEKKFNHQHSTPVSSYEVKFLKPCTEYEHHVTFVDHTGNETACNSTEDKTTTTGMNQDDIKEVSCTPGYVCYHSDWDISTSLSASTNIEPCKSNQSIFCIKPGFNDICSDLTTTFTCGNITLTKSISVDFLNPSEIEQKAPTKLPAEIKTTSPPNCKNLAVDYTCQDGKLNKVKNLSELEPFTQYSCTGQIKQNNVSIKNKETPAIVFTVDCDLDIRITNKKSTDTSIQLSWTKTSTNCPEPHLEKLSYVCSCSSSSHNGQTHSQSCSVSGLKPYTDYTCKVQPTYNNKYVSKPKQADRQKTSAGKPDNIHKLIVEHPEHNVIRVTCDRPVKSFNGPEKLYVARLYEASDSSKELKEEQKEKCSFEFRDLRYSTSYKVEVTAYNGEHESGRPKSKTVETYYNDKAVIGFLVFLVILTAVVLLFLIYKIYIYILRRRDFMNEVSEGVMLQTRAIYANVPQYEYRRKDAR